MHPNKRLPYAAALLWSFLLAVPAFADLASYEFTQTTGSAYDMSGATRVYNGSEYCTRGDIDDNASAATNIGFTFRFDGIDYTKFSVSTNGLIGLFRSWGSTSVSRCWENSLAQRTGGCFTGYEYTLDSIAHIAPLWDDLRVPSSCNVDGFDGEIRSKVFGSAPNRVFVIEFSQIEYEYYSEVYTTVQARLYEGTNVIEFWYAGINDGYYGDGASIGLAARGASSFISVTPGSPATISRTVADDGVDPSQIAANTVYMFAPCDVRLTGNTSQGGTATMASGDNLLSNQSVAVGSVGSFQPFTMSLAGSPCSNRSYSFSINGLYSNDYTITPTSGTLNAGGSTTPTITYRPTCAGSRPATLVMTGSDGTSRTFTLAPNATPQAAFAGNTAQGGTANVRSGDTLLAGIQQLRRTTASYQPLTVTNINSDPAAAPMPVTFTVNDPTGQYTVSPSNTTLAANQSVTPTITFNALGVSFQEATLTVATSCDTRTYLLRAFSSAPGGTLSAGGALLDSTSTLFVGTASCVGSGMEIVPITVTNTGTGDFQITGISFYRTDTMYMQGTSPFPVLRDEEGRPLPSTEYMLVSQPGGAPLTPSQALALPYTVPQGESRTIYAVFNGREAGRRYTIAYVQTNGQNLAATDVNGELVEGLIMFNLVGRAVGAQLASSPSGRALRSVVLPSVFVDDTSFVSFPVSNAGACDLLIQRNRLRIFSGDVNEFAFVSVLPNSQYDASSGMYRIAPGATDSIRVRFTPSRSGTRMATVLLQTNDSSIWIPGVTERGGMYVDLYGFGRAGLDATTLELPPVLVGGTVSGTATLENSSTASVEIRSITIVGPDAAQFRPSASQPWPALPARVLPGAKLLLAVDHLPVGDAGMRRAIIEVITTTNDTIRVGIRGEAGTLQLEVGPPTLFTDVQVPVGGYARRVVTIVNTGTFPIRLDMPRIVGPDSASYTLGILPRLQLAPGQTEYLEVTFQPTAQGSSSATLEIPSSVGTKIVQLGGEALGANNDDPSHDGVSAVTGGSSITRVDAIHPNPTSTGAEFALSLAANADVAVTLHDAAGRIVGTVAGGRYDAGRHTVRVDASSLASGVYHVRVIVNGYPTTMTLTVAR